MQCLVQDCEITFRQRLPFPLQPALERFLRLGIIQARKCTRPQGADFIQNRLLERIGEPARTW
jgi:hypothetical protein